MAFRLPFLYAKLVAVFRCPVRKVPEGGIFILEIMPPVIVTAPIRIFIECPCDKWRRRTGIVPQRISPVIGESHRL